MANQRASAFATPPKPKPSNGQNASAFNSGSPASWQYWANQQGSQGASGQGTIVNNNLAGGANVLVPGSPGVQNAPVQPFLTPQQMLEWGEGQQHKKENLAEFASNLINAETQEAYEAENVAKEGLLNHTRSGENLTARGLFHSSIRDGDLADIDAATALKKKFLETNLENLKITTKGKEALINDQWEKVYEPAWNALKVQNAQEAGANQGLYSTPPVAPHYEHVSIPNATMTNTNPGSQPARAFSPQGIGPASGLATSTGQGLGQNQPVQGNPANGGTEAPGNLGPKPPAKPKKIAGVMYG